MNKRIAKTSLEYVRRMVALINHARVDHKAQPMNCVKGSKFNGRYISEAWEFNGCLMGRSLNGEEFPINVTCVFDDLSGKPMRCGQRLGKHGSK